MISLEHGMNRILWENWYTDRALPPYDRVTMDGVAIRYETFLSGRKIYEIAGIAAAGMPQQTLNDPNTCLEVMTGSSLPAGTDTVIRYEDLDINNGMAEIVVDEIQKDQNVHFKGEDRSEGELVVPKFTKLSSAEIGVGASIGKDMICVANLPRVMVISTGDELVEISEYPEPHQIRRSNVYRITTSLRNYGIEVGMDHLVDDPKIISARLSKHLGNYDVIILSGGVSKGKFDYLPEVMEALGVKKLFHRISQRPGKPFWFGTYQESKVIFALPGNPISSFLCLHRYFMHWLELCLIGKVSEVPMAKLTADVAFKPDLTYFLEVKLAYSTTGEILANPMKGSGSGDLANLVKADGFIELPKGKDLYHAGEVYPVYLYR
jgi:molybdopterin molybdotransferase